MRYLILAWILAGCATVPRPFKLGDEVPAPRGCDKSAIERGVNC